MKQLIAVVLVLGLAVGTVYAQPRDGELKKVMIELEGDMNELQDELNDIPGAPKIMIKMNQGMDMENSAPDAPYMGVFVEDLDFPKAQELGYKGSVGVLITGVVQDSPAWTYRLQEDDIIINMDGKEVTNNAVFDKIRKNYRAGDKVVFEVFRSGEMLKVDFTFGSRQAKAPSMDNEKPGKKKLSPGYGGGSWVPMWFTGDLEDVNYMLNAVGFRKMDENGVLMQGGAGKGPIGKGFFIGGAGYGYTYSDKIQDTENSQYQIWMNYSNSMGGVTLDKRVPITKNIITSLGLMLGGGAHTLELMKSNSLYDWTNWDNTVMDSENTRAVITRGYLLVQPKAELMVRLLPWLGIRAEAGYVYGYSPTSGWKLEGMDNETIDIKNSPNTEYQGLTASIGPWFGF